MTALRNPPLAARQRLRRAMTLATDKWATGGNVKKHHGVKTLPLRQADRQKAKPNE